MVFEAASTPLDLAFWCILPGQAGNPTKTAGQRPDLSQPVSLLASVRSGLWLDWLSSLREKGRAMSVSNNGIAALLQAADPTAVAALLQMVNSGKAAGSQPKAESYVWQPIPKEWSIGWDIIRELRSRQYDSEAVVVSAAVDPKGQRPGYPEGVAATWDDGSPITFGDLAYVEEGGATNANGEAVNNYPVVWSLTYPEAKGALQFLRNCDRKAQQPKAAGGRRGGKATQPKAESGLTEAKVLQLIAEALALQTGVPAKPEPAVGHSKAPAKPVVRSKPQPASPVVAYDDHGQPVSEADLLPTLSEGQIVAFGNDLYQITVHANGRPAFRKTII